MSKLYSYRTFYHFILLVKMSEEIFQGVIIERGHINEEDIKHHSPVMVPSGLSARDSCGDGTFEFKFLDPKIKWSESSFPIKVFVNQSGNEVGTGITAAVQNALDEWQSRFNGKKMFEITTNQSDAKITIGWKKLDGSGQTVAICYYYWNGSKNITKNEIFFDTSENWTIMDHEVCGSTGNAFDFQSVLTHELGHGVGFAHDNDPLSCMYPSVRFGETLRRTLSLGNEKGFIELYEITAPPPPPPPTENNPPIASDIGITVDSGTVATITLDGSDPDGDPITFAIVDNPKNGRVNQLPGDKVLYTPTITFGTDSFTYIVTDSKGASSNKAIVNIVIKSVVPPPPPPENHPPVTKNMSLEMEQGDDISIHLQGSDPDGDSITYEITKQPKNGAFAIDPSTGHVQYRPQPEFFGMESFTYLVTDEHGAESQPADVVIVVNQVDDDDGEPPEGVIEISIEIPEKPTADDVLNAFLGLAEQLNKIIE